MRVGIGPNPFDRGGTGTPGFFRTAQLIEELGYEWLWLADTATRAGSAPLVTLAAVAIRTTTLKLGTSVLGAPARAPVVLIDRNKLGVRAGTIALAWPVLSAVGVSRHRPASGRWWRRSPPLPPTRRAISG
jgi:hypothetical protein